MTHLLVGARRSPLSQAQTVEVLNEIHAYHPTIEFECVFVDTYGDKDRITSLKSLDKTDFFTKEVDDLLLSGHCRIAIHSAKDLPQALPQGISLIAITKGVDKADCLVLRQGESIYELPAGAIIATSSQRREEIVSQIRDDLIFVDVRGTIQERLDLLSTGKADGVVVAEAALIRLGYTHLNRIRLEGETVPLQGQLAIVARTYDIEMATLFASIDTRRILYLGLEVPPNLEFNRVIHFPLIKIIPRPKENEGITQAFKEISKDSHILFTSKSSVEIFFSYLSNFNISLNHIKDKRIIAVGKRTAEKIQNFGLNVAFIATTECAEGIISLLETECVNISYLFWPHASGSRPIIEDWLQARSIPYHTCILYDTIPLKHSQVPDLNGFDEIIFTSPSVVRAFKDSFKELPHNKILSCIGPITQAALQG